jgi:hypothetical protein
MSLSEPTIKSPPSTTKRFHIGMIMHHVSKYFGSPIRIHQENQKTKNRM